MTQKPGGPAYAEVYFDSRACGFKTSPSYTISIGIDSEGVCPNENLSKAYQQSISTLAGHQIDFQIIEPVNYAKYRIDGHKSVSWIWRARIQGKVFDDLEVATIINKTVVDIGITSPGVWVNVFHFT